MTYKHWIIVYVYLSILTFLLHIAKIINSLLYIRLHKFFVTNLVLERIFLNVDHTLGKCSKKKPVLKIQLPQDLSKYKRAWIIYFCALRESISSLRKKWLLSYYLTYFLIKMIIVNFKLNSVQEFNFSP